MTVVDDVRHHAAMTAAAVALQGVAETAVDGAMIAHAAVAGTTAAVVRS